MMSILSDMNLDRIEERENKPRSMIIKRFMHPISPFLFFFLHPEEWFLKIKSNDYFVLGSESIKLVDKIILYPNPFIY